MSAVLAILEFRAEYHRYIEFDAKKGVLCCRLTQLLRLNAKSCMSRSILRRSTRYVVITRNVVPDKYVVRRMQPVITMI